MRKSVSVPSSSESVRTYYQRPFLDRIFGKYTVEWSNNKIQIYSRLQDFEGYLPSFLSILYLPKIIWTYLATRRQPILKHPIPFLCVDAVRFLDSVTRSDMRVLEIGGGNSTLWFLYKGMNVITIENSEEWASAIERHIGSLDNPRLAENHHMEIKEGTEAITYIENMPDESFDIILVDCLNEFTSRRLCLRAARRKVRKGGWLVLDNSDYPIHWAGVDMMTDRKRIRLTGYAYMTLSVCQTSFWQM